MLQYQPPVSEIVDNLSQEVDWRKFDAVTHVQNQVPNKYNDSAMHSR